MESHLNLYFREIVYHNPSAKKNSVCGVFSYEALNIEEAKVGNLYLAGKISNFSSKQHKNYDFLLGVLTSVLKREFYSDPQKNSAEALESALQSANIYLDDFTKKGHKEWIGNFDFTCFAFSKNNIHISQTGDMLIYLFRKNNMSNISRKFLNQNNKTKPLKTFSNIASGSLEENDKIIIATSDILEILPSQKIKEFLSRSSTEELFNYLKDNLKKTKSLACLILEARTKPPVIKKEKPKIEESQKQIISLDLERVFNSKSNKFNNLVKNRIPSLSKYSKFLTTLFKYHLPKYLLIFLVFLILILSPYIAQKINYDSKLKQVDDLIKRIQESINKSETSLVYQNQSQAQALLQQANALAANANSLIDKLPDRVKTESSQILQEIEKNLNNQENSINNVINITQPEEIADLSRNSFSFNPNGILKLENNLFLYELTSGFLYKINLDDIKNPVLIFLSSKDTFKLGAVRDSAIVLLSNPEKIYIYATNDNYNTYLLKPSLGNTLNIKDMTTYGEYLYFLDAENLNILKYTPQETSLEGINWLNEEFRQDLIDAQSLDIDGSIYVSKKDGTIIEYISGRKAQEFKPNISPELKTGSQLFTKPEMKNLYILDPANNRIIALNKKDRLAIQYVSAQFDSLTDIWVTPDERTVYVLNGLKVYRINI